MRVQITAREFERRLIDFRNDPDNYVAIERADDGTPQLRIALGNGDACFLIEIISEVHYVSESDRIRETADYSHWLEHKE
jgi:hypothetical protein